MTSYSFLINFLNGNTYGMPFTGKLRSKRLELLFVGNYNFFELKKNYPNTSIKKSDSNDISKHIKEYLKFEYRKEKINILLNA